MQDNKQDIKQDKNEVCTQVHAAGDTSCTKRHVGDNMNKAASGGQRTSAIDSQSNANDAAKSEASASEMEDETSEARMNTDDDSGAAITDPGRRAPGGKGQDPMSPPPLPGRGNGITKQPRR